MSTKRWLFRVTLLACLAVILGKAFGVFPSLPWVAVFGLLAIWIAPAVRYGAIQVKMSRVDKSP